MIPSFTLGVPMVPTSSPFLIVPANPPKSSNNHSQFAHYTPSFPVAVAPKSAKNSDINASQVAHNNAHHLHSIPPAHKSTKSMILDHLLHLHAEARLAQVSAELGLSTIDQDVQESHIASERLCNALRYGPQAPSTPLKLIGRREEPQARALMARANGLEKVIGAMLGNAASNESLPESVRFRIALGMLIDDIVAFRRVESTNQLSTPNIPPMLTFLSKPRRESNASSPATSGILNSHSWAQPLGIVGSTLVREPSRSKELFNSGAGLSSPRCNRHLVPSCHRCAAKVPSSSRQTSIGSGLASTQVFPDCGDSKGSAGTLESIPYFLQLSALVCSRLSASQRQQQLHERSIRESLDDTVSFASTSSFSSTDSGTPHPTSSAGDMPVSEEEEQISSTVSPNSRKRDMLPFRFSRGETSPYMHHHQTGSKRSMDIDEAEEELVRPTREWHALLAGLLTRALLEGYLLRGWKGTQAAEILFGVGLANDEGKLQGKKRKKEEQKKANGKSSFFVWSGVDQQQQQQPLDAEAKAPTEPETSSASHMLPEDLPSMEQASSILFGTSTAFQEYAMEVEKRFTEFTTVAQQTPDLTSHLDALARAYPLEPIQTAALRFCEAVSLWRKNPELEEYKSRSGHNEATASPNLSSSFPIPNGVLPRQTNDYTSSPSIQSHSPMLQSTPSGQRARLSPSISIASLVHPSSSPPLSSIHTISDRVSFLGLSGSNSSTTGASRFSVVPAPLRQFFATLVISSSDAIAPGTGFKGTTMKTGGSRIAWAGFTLGAKRPREKETEGWESERATKKTFLRGGFNS